MRRPVVAIAGSLFWLCAANAAWHSVSQVAITPPGSGDVVASASVWYSCTYAYNIADTAAACNVCLPSDSACADLLIVNGLATIPSALSTCNNSSVICTVKTAYDKSGNSRNVTQATINNRPRFVVPGVSNGCSKNSLPCMYFSVAGQNLAGTTAATISQPYTYSIVANTGSGNAAFEPVFGGNNGGDPFQFDSTAGANPRINVYAGSNTGVPQQYGIWFNVQAATSGASSVVYLNNSSVSVSPGSNPVGVNIYLGTDGYGDNWTGYLSEAGIWPIAFNSTQAAALNYNQNARYNPLAFENDGVSQPWFSNSFGNSGFYNSSTGVVWLSWQGWQPVSGTLKRVARLATYNVGTGVWAGPYTIGTSNTLGSTDPHGVPACVQDSSGYVYCFYDAHNSTIQLVATATANDPTSFTAQSAVGSNATFYEPVYNASVNKIFVFYSTPGVGGGNQTAIKVLPCTPSSGTVSCASAVNLFDVNAAGSAWLPMNYTYPVGVTKIHLVFEYGAVAVGGAVTNLYYAIYDTSTGTVCNFSGLTCIISGSQPVSLSSLNTNFLVYTGVNISSAQFLVDSNGTAHVVLAEGSNASAPTLFYTNNSGSGWSTPVTLFTYPSTFNAAAGSAALYINSAGNLTVQFADASAGGGTGRGAIQQTTLIGGSWSTPITILGTQGSQAVDIPTAILNGPPAARTKIGETTSDYVTVSGGLRGYLYGESLFLANPAGL